MNRRLRTLLDPACYQGCAIFCSLCSACDSAPQAWPAPGCRTAAPA